MPVQVTCSCGKLLKVPEQYAGKRVKCPKCGAPNSVPSETVAVKRDTQANTVYDPPPPGMVRFRCTCGKQMQAKAAYAGRMTRCPACQATLPIPARSEALPAAEGDASPDATVNESTLPSAVGSEAAPAEKKTPKAKSRATWRVAPRKLMVGCLILAALSSLAAAGWWLLRGGTPADLALVPADARALASLQLAQAWQAAPVQAALKEGAGKSDLTADLERTFGLPVADIERVSLVVRDASKGEEWLIVAAHKPFDRAKILAHLEGGAKAGKSPGKAYHVAAKAGPGNEHQAAWFTAGDRVVVLASEPALKVFLSLPPEPKPDGPLADALHRTAGSSLAVVLGPAPGAAVAGEAVAPSGPAGLLLEALANRLTADAAPSPLGRKKLLGRFEATLKDLSTAGDATGVVTELDAQAIVDAVVKPALAALKSAASTAAGQSNLQQIGEAFLAYHKAKNRFPSAAVVKNNKPLYSWRVELLPFLGEQALYDQFKKDEPYDSPANKALWSKMPKVFALPEKPGDSDKTYYQVFVGPKALFTDAARAPKLADISVSPGKVILVVEAAKPVIWCEPVDLPFVAGSAGIDPKLLGGHFGDVFHAIMADGSPVAVKRTIKPQTLQTILMPGKRPPPGDDWEAAIGP